DGDLLMRFVDEYRSRDFAQRLSQEIAARLGSRAYKMMEVCGGHTHTIYKHGVEDYLPEGLTLVHGPGCPVCVIPMGRVDDARFVAEQRDVILATFGDMLRVPGERAPSSTQRHGELRFGWSIPLSMPSN